MVKAKQLFLIPEMEVATTKMVAEYFGVDMDTLRKVYQRNKEEIDGDGVQIMQNVSQFLEGHNVTARIRQKMGYKEIDFGTMTVITPNANVKIFPRRAILRIAMLLRDSEVAKEIRTQLLNTFEHATEEQRTYFPNCP
jgi:hypothetical protein